MTRKAKIDWFMPKMTGMEGGAVQAVLDANFLNDGPLTRQFETAVADIAGCRFGVAVTSGTAAIACALVALGIGPGDEVIVPNLTFIATANAVRLAGAEPVLADVEPRRFTLSPAAVERRLTAKTKAIVPVDVNGRGAAYEWFEPFCARHGLALVSDSAEALGSAYRGRPLGSYGNAGCFSFSPNKIATTGQGGVITTNDERLYHRLLEVKDQGRPVRGSGGDDLHPAMGFNFKFTDVQAAIGLAQLKELEARRSAMLRRDEWYQEYLGNLSSAQLGDQSEPGELRLWIDFMSDRRTDIVVRLDEAKIGYRNFWYPLSSQKPYHSNEAFPETVRISAAGCWLPSTFDITEADVREVASVITSALA